MKSKKQSIQNQSVNTRVKVANVATSVLLFVSSIALIVAICFFTMIKVTWGFSLEPIWPLPVIGLLVVVLMMMLQMMLRVSKLWNTNNTIFSTAETKQKVYSGLVLVLSVVVIGMAGFVGWAFMKPEKPPVFFPFDDNQATYTIQKYSDNSGTFILVYDSRSDRNSMYVCDRESGRTNCRTEINRNVHMTIGKSDRELDSLVGKPVRVTGDFVYSTEQCIAGACKEFGSRAVLDLHSIEEVK